MDMSRLDKDIRPSSKTVAILNKATNFRKNTAILK